MTIETVKQQRQDLSRILNSLPVSPTANGRYTALAKTNLEQGRMWTGRILGLLGEQYPYTAESYGPACVTDELVQFEETWDDKIKIGKLRALLGKEGDLLASWYTGSLTEGPGTPVTRFKLKMAIRNAFTGIEQAKMWLGMELAEVLRNSQKI